jgi:hypothetical protein
MQGDTLNEGTLQKLGHTVLSASGLAMSVFGFLVEEQLLTFLWSPFFGQPTWLWLAEGIVVAGVVFHFPLSKYREGFRASLKYPSDWLWSFFIGGLGRGFWNLSLGLLPFYQNPWVFVVLAIYIFIIADVLLMKKSFGRLSDTRKPRWISL